MVNDWVIIFFSHTIDFVSFDVNMYTWYNAFCGLQRQNAFTSVSYKLYCYVFHTVARRRRRRRPLRVCRKSVTWHKRNKTINFKWKHRRYSVYNIQYIYIFVIYLRTYRGTYIIYYFTRARFKDVLFKSGLRV